MGSIRNKHLNQITCNWLAVCACLLFGACSGHGHGLVTGGMEAVASTEVAGELALLETPDGVDPAVWDGLKAAFADLAIQRSSAGVPVTEANRIDTLTYVADEGTHRVTWQYRNNGDYNQDGIVGVTDLTPIGVHYGKTSDSPDWAEARLADGNDDGLIGMADITPIGQNYDNRVDGYYLEATADDQAGVWEIIASVAFAGAVEVEGQPILRFYADLEAAPIGLSFRATPYANRQGSDTPESGIIGSPVTLVADGRSDWWMEFSDRRHSCFSNYEGPVTNHVWWSLNLDGESSSSPIYDGQGTIIAGGNNGLYFIEPDGSSYWCLGTPAPVNTTPAQAADGTIYFGCDDGNLYAISPDGLIQWTWQSGGPLTASPAIADDGTIWFGTEDCRLIALNPDGSLMYESPTESEVYYSPAISDDGVAFARTGVYSSAGVMTDGIQLRGSYLRFKWFSLIEMMIYKTLGETEEEAFRETETWAYSDTYSTPVQDAETVFTETYYKSLFQLDRTYHSPDYPLIKGPGSTFYSLNDNSCMERYSLIGNETNQPTMEWSSEYQLGASSVDTTGACFGTTSTKLTALKPDGTLRWWLKGEYEGVPVIGPNHNLIVRTEDGSLVSIGGELDGTLPATVAAPEITFDDSSLTNRLKWYPANGADYYEVYREDLAEPIQVVSLTDETSYGYFSLTDEAVSPGLPYYYKVRAVNAIGTGEFSPSVLGAARIPAPETMTASQGTSPDAITLEWSAVNLATGYRIYADAWTEESVPLGEASAPATSWDHTTRTDWDEHVYYVTAFNEYSESLPVEATGWLIRGTGDTGPGDWHRLEHDAGRSNRSNLTGPAAAAIAWEFQPDQRFDSHAFAFGSALTGAQGSLYFRCNNSPYTFFGVNDCGELSWTREDSGAPFHVYADGSIATSGQSTGQLASNGVLLESLDLSSYALTYLSAGEYLINDNSQLTRYTSDGSVVWQSPITSPHTGSANIAVAPDGTIYQMLYHPVETTSKQGGADPSPYPGSDNYVFHIRAVNPDGTERWLRDDIDSTYADPLAIEGPAVFLSTGDTTFALDTTDGTTRWSFPVSGRLAADHLGRLVLTTDYSLVVFDDAGEAVWEYILPTGFICSNPAVTDQGNKVYLTISDGDSYKVRYICFDSVGTELWSHEIRQATMPSPMVINQDGNLICPYMHIVDDKYRARVIAFGE